MWFVGDVSNESKALLGKPAPNGSYLSYQPFKTSNLTVLEDEVYATVGNPEFKATSGKTFYLPKGTIVAAKTYNSQPIGKNLAIIEADDYIKTLNEEDQKEIRKSGDDFKGIKIIISTEGNSQVMSKFIGEYTTPQRTQSNRSITRLKKLK